MSWKDILKKETVNLTDLTNKIINPLNDFLNEQLVIRGEYDEELDGYRDAGEDEYRIGRGRIKIIPDMTHDEHDDVTTEFDIEYYGEDDYYNGVRLGSYTGGEGHYLASEDWSEHDLEVLLSLYRDLSR
tara:strand:+ start:4112 stop:4498 length:387 start_codon:yes stop_codon:yes gene_type:complete